MNDQERPRVAKEINDLVKQHDCRIIVTCRTQVYRDEFSSIVDCTLEVAEFVDSEILRFLEPWKAAMTQVARSNS